MELMLSDPEARILREMLETGLTDLLREIARTDNRSMRAGLKKREDLLRGILDRLGAALLQAS